MAPRRTRFEAVVEWDGRRAVADLARQAWRGSDAEMTATLTRLFPLRGPFDAPGRVEYEPDPTAPLRRRLINAGARVVSWPTLVQPDARSGQTP